MRPEHTVIGLIAALTVLLATAVFGWVRAAVREGRLHVRLARVCKERAYWYSCWRKLAASSAVRSDPNRSVNTPAVTPTGEPSQTEEERRAERARTIRIPMHQALTQFWRK